MRSSAAIRSAGDVGVRRDRLGRSASFTTSPKSDIENDAAIRKLYAAFQAAWNGHKVPELVEMWIEDGAWKIAADRLMIPAPLPWRKDRTPAPDSRGVRQIRGADAERPVYRG